MMLATRRHFLSGTTAGMAALALGACAASEESATTEGQEANASVEAIDTSALGVDMGAWRYNADDDVYWQTGIAYCAAPADEAYESLAIFVPGPYFSSTDNGDGTFTCEVSTSGVVGSYSAATAPVVMPVETPGYSAMEPLSDYVSVAEFTSAGLVYVHAGCRGREHGAPAGVTDLKAAVRFLRHVAGVLPGSVDHIVTFGMSGGGAQSALMGATGDSELYEPYLASIGAVMDTSDAIYGSMDWCPITGLDVGDAAYAWMMGCTREGLSEEEQAISDGLALQFATYLNAAGIRDEQGSELVLEESPEGIFQAGSYYERVKAAIEQSLNDFLSDTTFPYDASSASSGFGGGMGGRMGAGGPGGRPDGAPDGKHPGDGMPAGERPDGATPEGTMAGDGTDGDGTGDEVDFSAIDDISRTQTSSGLTLTGAYETVADYIEALNTEGEWVTYDQSSNTVQVSSVEAFVKALKGASKGLGAFDQLDRGQGENTLFGIGGEPRHFDALLGAVLDEAGSAYAQDSAADMAEADAMGTDMQTRVNMYTPLYYLLEAATGYGSSVPARHWRIRSGINQGDTALTTELNLALALENDPRVDSVDFAAVWGQGHTKAERTGESDANFIAWVQSLA